MSFFSSLIELGRQVVTCGKVSENAKAKRTLTVAALVFLFHQAEKAFHSPTDLSLQRL
jgi:ribosomal protein L18E